MCDCKVHGMMCRVHMEEVLYIYVFNYSNTGSFAVNLIFTL